jgi:hypothetical protein
MERKSCERRLMQNQNYDNHDGEHGDVVGQLEEVQQEGKYKNNKTSESVSNTMLCCSTITMGSENLQAVMDLSKAAKPLLVVEGNIEEMLPYDHTTLYIKCSSSYQMILRYVLLGMWTT